MQQISLSVPKLIHPDTPSLAAYPDQAHASRDAGASGQGRANFADLLAEEVLPPADPDDPAHPDPAEAVTEDEAETGPHPVASDSDSDMVLAEGEAPPQSVAALPMRGEHSDAAPAVRTTPADPAQPVLAAQTSPPAHAQGHPSRPAAQADNDRGVPRSELPDRPDLPAKARSADTPGLTRSFATPGNTRSQQLAPPRLATAQVAAQANVTPPSQEPYSSRSPSSAPSGPEPLTAMNPADRQMVQADPDVRPGLETARETVRNNLNQNTFSAPAGGHASSLSAPPGPQGGPDAAPRLTAPGQVMQAAPEQRQTGDSWQPGQAGRLLAALHAAPNAALNGDPKGMSVAVEVQAQQATQPVAQAQPATLSLQGAASGAPSLVHTPAAARDPAGDGPLQVDELRLSAEPGTAPLRPVAAGHLQRPGTPPHIAAQIAGAIQRSGPNPTIDLSLNPAELGRVKISLQPSDGVVLVHVVADRGETLDLLRRHAEQLAQEFHSIGYGEAQFSFSRQSSDQGPANEAGPHPEGSREQPLAPGEGAPLPRPSIGLTMSDRVDIRV